VRPYSEKSSSGISGLNLEIRIKQTPIVEASPALAGLSAGSRGILALCSVIVILFLGAMSLSGYAQVVTPVRGESWLEHIHRSLDDTSMGKASGVYGPEAEMPGESPLLNPTLMPSYKFTTQNTTLYGSDLYRLKCQGCHGASGAGAPPEINSVIDPVRATSAKMYVDRMKKVGMDVKLKDAALLANQAQATLLERLHKGGTDMPPPDPYLSDVELHSLLTYLRELAGIPGATGQQAPIVESSLRVGEHVVKSTCHVCHTSIGHNPTPAELEAGQIPPLSSLTSRLSINEFVAKVTVGASVPEGALAIPVRGHMPVFTYLTSNEAADAYFYLSLYPPQQ
jgi:mono/diheme cytochrome c family protein